MKLDENEMWKAVSGSNPLYDGIFYYAVKTTRIFCRPSCRSRTPLRENTIFFENIDEAVKNGYKPCKRCQPDQFINCSENHRSALVSKINNIIEDGYSDPYLLDKLHLMMNFSRFHLQRLYKNETGITPRAFLQNLRIKKAVELLNNTEMTSIEVCYAVGFKSTSCFYETFKAITGFSPKEFREKGILEV